MFILAIVQPAPAMRQAQRGARYPTHRCVKARVVVQATRRLAARYDAWQSGAISFGELDASVQGWVNHIRYADTWGLRRRMLAGYGG